MNLLRPLVLVLSLLAGIAPLRAEPIHVAVSIPPQKYLVERIGRDRIDVMVMLQPGHAPETYEPSPRQIANLNEAQVYFRIGVPFERVWLEPLTVGGSGLVVVDCCRELIVPSPQDTEAATDPHVWVNPLQAIRIADLMRLTLVRIDPANAKVYADNFAALRADLTRLHEEIGIALKDRRTPYFIISHGSLGPFADAYGLVQISLEAGGHSAGPKRLAEIEQRARAEGIRTILIQKQLSSAAARTLAGEIGAQLVEIDPLAEDYIAGMRAIAGAVAAATR